jgi:hypothetical protein
VFGTLTRTSDGGWLMDVVFEYSTKQTKIRKDGCANSCLTWCTEAYKQTMVFIWVDSGLRQPRYMLEWCSKVVQHQEGKEGGIRPPESLETFSSTLPGIIRHDTKYLLSLSFSSTRSMSKVMDTFEVAAVLVQKGS